jgi:signal transduction histidine kinase
LCRFVCKKRIAYQAHPFLFAHGQARRTIEGIEVEVVDTCEGIRPEDLPYVFDRFYSGYFSQ